MDRQGLAAARVRRFLETEPVIWLSTTCADGAPHLVPTWFAWNGETITFVSKPGARKVRNLRADKRAMLALGDAEAEFDVGLVHATAEVVPEPTPPGLPPGYLAKYGRRIAEIGLSPARFAAIFRQQVRLRPERALPWDGRLRPAPVRRLEREFAAAV